MRFLFPLALVMAGPACADGEVAPWSRMDGGASRSGGGNDLDVYDIAANEWSQLTEEENWKRHLGNDGVTPDSDPSAGATSARTAARGWSPPRATRIL